MIDELNLSDKRKKLYKNIIKSSFLDEELESVEFNKVPIKKIYPTQEILESSELEQAYEHPESPVLLKEAGGKYYIFDGHHRAYVNFWKKKNKIDAVVLHCRERSSYNKYDIDFPTFARIVRIK